jgi:uncharacterized lipoprotein YbaY
LKNVSLVLVISALLIACGDQKAEEQQVEVDPADVKMATQDIEMVESEMVEAEIPLLDNSATISGEITYEGEVVLPENALLVVRLVDLSNPEKGVTTLLTQSYILEGALPYLYELNYERSLINDTGRYGLRAVVRLGEKVFLTGGSNLDISQDAGAVLSLNLKDVK